MLQVLLEGKVPGVVTWLGTIFGLIGLALTYAKAQAARQSSDRAAAAVKGLSTRVGLSRVGVAASQLDTLRMVVDAGHHHVAAALVAPLRRSIVQVSSAAGAGDNAVDPLSVPFKNLRTIDAQLSASINHAANFKVSLIVKALAGLDEHLSGLESALIDKTEGEKYAKP